MVAVGVVEATDEIVTGGEGGEGEQPPGSRIISVEQRFLACFRRWWRGDATGEGVSLLVPSCTYAVVVDSRGGSGRVEVAEVEGLRSRFAGGWVPMVSSLPRMIGLPSGG
jgi:hypothetical protein